MSKCKHAINGHQCERPTESHSPLGYCIFHAQITDIRKPPVAEFAQRLQQLLDQGDGDFCGFIFPRNFIVDNSMLDFSNVDNVDFSFSNFDGGAVFNNITFNCNVNLMHVDMGSDFVMTDCVFNEDCLFGMTKFRGSFVCDSEFRGKVDFSSCHFDQMALFVGDFYGPVEFFDSVFLDRAKFRGRRLTAPITGSGSIAKVEQTVIQPFQQWFDKKLGFLSIMRIIGQNLQLRCQRALFQFRKQKHDFIFNLSSKVKANTNDLKQWIESEWLGQTSGKEVEIRSLFHAEVSLIDVDFRRPERVSFLNVSFSKTKLIGTDFSGVQFSDVNWFQPKLKRNGIYEEVELNNYKDMKHKRFKRPQLEEAYRNIRRTLEAYKDYDTASDFLVGEMEQKRKLIHPSRRWFFSIIGLYALLSNYGTRSFRVLLWLVLVMTIHFAVTNTIFGQDLADSGLRTLQVITLQKPEITNTYQGYLDALLRLSAPILIALFAISIRARIKRF